MGNGRNRNAHKPLALLLAVAVAVGLVAPVLADIQWPTKIERFERNDPVYTKVVEPGTSKAALNLPDALRAVISLDEFDRDASSFVQAEPEADLSDGSEHYDYYYYGYVAPKNAEELYAAGKIVVYSIYYAARDKDGNPLSTVGEIAYRVYGAIDGSENLWFACDEDGAIKGVVLDIPVVWENGGYDADTPGEYTFTAAFSGYTYAEARPFAKITIQDAANAEDGHEETGEGIHCTCEVGDDAVSAAHAEDCPYYHADCTCAYGKNEASSEHEEGCAWYTVAEAACTCGAAAGEAHAEGCPLYSAAADEGNHCTCEVGSDVVSAAHAEDCPYYHADCNCAYAKNEASSEHDESCPWYAPPKYTCTCALATNKLIDGHDESCPYYVRHAVDCHCGPEGEAIDADNFPWAHQEDCVYFSPVECMCREVLTEEIVDPETGKKETSTYAGEFTHVHDPDNKQCPLYGRDTVRIRKLASGEESVMGADDAMRIAAAQAVGNLLYPLLGEIEIIEGSEQAGKGAKLGISLFSINGGGANDVAQDNFMTANTATSGNREVAGGYGAGTPGTWVDYVNTIWMNKAYNKFSWTAAEDTGAYVYNGTRWAWGGTMAGSYSGSVTTNPLRVPSVSSRVWSVYSGEQLLYALNNVSSIQSQTIRLMANINLNGNAYSWTQTTLSGSASVTIDGNGRTIYNAGVFTTGSGDIAIFSTNSSGLTIQNLTLATAKMVGGGRVMPIRSYSSSGHTYTNVHNIGSLLYTTADVATGLGSLQPPDNTSSRTTVTNCSVQGCYIRSRDHALGFAGSVGNTTISNCFVADTLIDSYGGHSSGFIYCHSAAPNVAVSNCFASTEIYGAKYVVGFGTPFGANRSVSNCFATGKIEGYEYLTGFSGIQTSNQLNTYTSAVTTYNNCYTTALVGMRSEAAYIGGFMGVFPGGDGTVYVPARINNCYAAGEVGDFTTNMDNPVNVGGFLTNTDTRITITNSYYDKQTTAMREWASGNSKTVSGVTGVLTTNTTNGGSTITGLASGNYGTNGFRGFADNTQWTYSAGHYPQLNVFATASSGFGGYSALVRAYSLASTSTVFLDTWQNGYDWSDTGVRTKNKVSYGRTLASTGATHHKGYELTYDTVREIISPFSVTTDAGYSHTVGSGAPSQKKKADGSTSIVTSTVNINDTTKTGSVVNPGMDWYRISAVYGGRTGYRPIRLIAYMGIDAGTNKTITVGQTYNHRPDVELTVVDTLASNLIVGMDDSKVWSSSKQGGYPNSNKYYALATDNMETSFPISKNAWIYTEIWRAKQNPDGSYAQDASYGYNDGTNNLVPDLSVKVTGSGTGSNLTVDEQKWNGDYPNYPDTSVERKYIISYYWMLTDGRYVTDYKIITVEPGTYYLKLDVLSMQSGQKTDPANTDSLYIGTAVDQASGGTGYTLSPATATQSKTEAIPFAKNTAAAWKKLDDDVVVVKTEIDFYDAQNNLQGSASVSGELTAGSTITIPTTYYYMTKVTDPIQGEREITSRETVSVTYTIMQDANGAFYLRFNKLANVPSDEVTPALAGTNDSTGIPAGALAYINDMVFNTEITLWVTHGRDFEFIKTDKAGVAFGEGEAEFQLYACAQAGGSHVHAALASNEAGNCWTTGGGAVRTAATDVSGRVRFEKLLSGDYMLVETKTKEGLQLPAGQWLLEVDAGTGTIAITARGAELPPAFKSVAGEGGAAVLYLPNYETLTMPSTGGIGVIFFTVGGIALLGAAVIFLIATRRRKP